MELILHNGNIMTMDRETPRAQAVAVKEGLIFAVGADEEILPLATSETEITDLQGKSLLPGFNDSHMHLYSYSLTSGMVDLRQLSGIDELRVKLSAYITDNNLNKGNWVMGWGWDQTPYKEKRMPARRDLDAVSAEHPMMLMRTCGHVCALNTPALKAAGIFEKPPAVEGGLVEVDKEGVPTGILKEKAMELVLSLFPQTDKNVMKFLIVTAAQDFLKAGLTSVQTDDLNAYTGDMSELLQAYKELEEEQQLPVRVTQKLLLPNTEKLDLFLQKGLKTGDGGSHFKIGPLKLLMDGSLGGRSAALSATYSDDPGNSGITIYNREQLEKLVTRAHLNALQVAVHAIGDRAIETVLDVFKKVQEKHPRREARFRIVHASAPRPHMLDRFKEQNIAVDVQPCFVPSDLPFIEDRLGERAVWAFTYKEFLKRGINLGGGSDCPVEDYRPLLGIHAAVNRQGYDGKPEEGWLPEQKLTLQEAVYMYTMGSAYNSFDEKLKGSVTPGKLADMVVLSADIEKINPQDIKDLTVEKTIVGGKTEYRYN